jgi:enamine deaminase RidA (YjgF/YER057c/UK114 family)
MANYLNPKGAAPAQGLYSHATRVDGGPLYFVAGQLAVNAAGDIVGKNDFAAQFDQVFQNLADVLKALHASFDDIVKFTTYLVSEQHLEIFMKKRAEYFPTVFTGSDYPPNTLLTVKRLVKEDFLFEVEAIVQAK